MHRPGSSDDVVLATTKFWFTSNRENEEISACSLNNGKMRLLYLSLKTACSIRQMGFVVSKLERSTVICLSSVFDASVLDCSFRCWAHTVVREWTPWELTAWSWSLGECFWMPTWNHKEIVWHSLCCSVLFMFVPILQQQRPCTPSNPYKAYTVGTTVLGWVRLRAKDAVIIHVKSEDKQHVIDRQAEALMQGRRVGERRTRRDGVQVLYTIQPTGSTGERWRPQNPGWPTD